MPSAASSRSGGVGLELRAAEAPAARSTDWSRLFVAAGLDAPAFKEVPVVLWAPVFGADETRAWEGAAGGNALRVEAGAYRGRPVQFLVRTTTTKPLSGWPGTQVDRRRGAGLGRSTRLNIRWALDMVLTVTMFAAVAVLAVLARRNLRLGRGDRRGAYALAIIVFVAEAQRRQLCSHSGSAVTVGPVADGPGQRWGTGFAAFLAEESLCLAFRESPCAPRLSV